MHACVPDTLTRTCCMTVCALLCVCVCVCVIINSKITWRCRACVGMCHLVQNACERVRSVCFAMLRECARVVGCVRADVVRCVFHPTFLRAHSRKRCLQRDSNRRPLGWKARARPLPYGEITISRTLINNQSQTKHSLCEPVCFWRSTHSSTCRSQKWVNQNHSKVYMY